VSPDTARPLAGCLDWEPTQPEERIMNRVSLPLLSLALLIGCRATDKPPGGARAAEGTRTGSAYSTGSDTTAMNQRIEGTNTGAEFEAPRRIPGVLAALDVVSQRGPAPSQENLTALRGSVSSMTAAMRSDFTRVGEADTGAFRDLADSLGRQIGGTAGGLADEMDPSEVPQLSARVRRLIGLYQERMKHAQQ
jgi:hypothetical protein